MNAPQQVKAASPWVRTERQTTRSCSRVDVFTSVYMPARLKGLSGELDLSAGLTGIEIELYGGTVDSPPLYFKRDGTQL